MRVTLRGAWDFISTTVVAVAALTMLLFYLHDRTGDAPPSVPALAVVDDWRDWDGSANRIGSEEAAMVVAAFMGQGYHILISSASCSLTRRVGNPRALWTFRGVDRSCKGVVGLVKNGGWDGILGGVYGGSGVGDAPPAGPGELKDQFSQL